MSGERCSTYHAKRVVVLTIPSRRRKLSTAFHTCIHFYCAIIGVSYTWNPGYTLETLKWAERVVTLIIRCEQRGLFKYVSTFSVRSLGHGSQIQKILGIHSKIQHEQESCNTRHSTPKNRAFQICIHFCYAIIGVWFAELTRKIIKAFPPESVKTIVKKNRV